MKNIREVLESLVGKGSVNVKFENPAGLMIEYPGDDLGSIVGSVQSVEDELLLVKMNTGKLFYIAISSVILVSVKSK